MALLLLLALTAAPARPLPPLPAPLGRIDEALTELPAGGHQAGDPWIVVHPAGCDHDQGLYLMRFMGGAMMAARKVDAWLRSVPQEERRLFGGKHLIDFLTPVEKSSPGELRSCGPRGGSLQDVVKAPKLCARESATEHWFTEGDHARALVLVSPAAEGADACRPRITAVLFDEQGRARFRFLADYGAALTVAVEGDGCKGLEFVYDKAGEQFVARMRPAPKVCKP